MPQTLYDVYVLVIESNMILLIRFISIKLKLNVECQNGWWLCHRHIIVFIMIIIIKCYIFFCNVYFEWRLPPFSVHFAPINIQSHGWYNNIIEHWTFNNFVSIYLNGITAIQPYCLLPFQFLITNAYNVRCCGFYCQWFVIVGLVFVAFDVVCLCERRYVDTHI